MSPKPRKLLVRGSHKLAFEELSQLQIDAVRWLKKAVRTETLTAAEAMELVRLTADAITSHRATVADLDEPEDAIEDRLDTPQEREREA